jgi:cell division protein FtsL
MATASRLAWIDAWEQGLTPSQAETRSAARVTARMRSTRYYGREATARLPQPEPATRRQEALPELKVVTRRKPRWGLILLTLIFVSILVGTVIIAPVLVSAAATGVEAQVGQLGSQEQELATATSALSAQVSALSSPDRVAEQAAELGLGPARSVHYMEAAGGSVATEGDTTVAGR